MKNLQVLEQLMRLASRAHSGAESGTEVWLFGSTLERDDPSDLDLLVVYDEEKVSTRDALEIRARVSCAIIACGLPIPDVMLLSRAELEQTRFLERVRAMRLT